MKHKLRKVLLIFILAFFLAMGGAMAILQSPTGREWIKEKMISAAKAQGAALSIEEIRGDLPFTWKLRGVAIHHESIFFESQKVDATFSPLRLLIGELSIREISFGKSQLNLHDAHTPTSQAHVASKLESFRSFSSPIPVRIRKLQAERIHIRSGEKEISLAVTGKLRIRRKGRPPFVMLSVRETLATRSFFECVIDRGKTPQNLRLGIGLHLESTKAIAPLITLPFDTELSLAARLEGPWKTWEAFFDRSLEGGKPIDGQFDLETTGIKWERLEALKYPSKVKSTFAIGADRSLNMQRLALHNPLLILKMQSSFAAPQGRERVGRFEGGSLTFTAPNLSLWNSDLPFELDGRLEGTGEFYDEQGNFHITTSNLQVAKRAIAKTEALLQTTRNGELWKGSIALDGGERKQIPISGKILFSAEGRERLHFQQVELAISSSRLSGEIDFCLPTLLAEGNLDIKIGNLNRLKPLRCFAPIQGSLKTELQITRDLLRRQQNLSGNLTGRFINLNALSTDLFTTSFVLDDIWGDPTGKFSLASTDFRYGGIYFDQVEGVAETSLLEVANLWNFNLEAKGESAALQLEGALAPGTLQVHTLEGIILNEPVHFSHPFDLNWSNKEWLLSPLRLLAGSGSLEMDAHFTQESGQANLSMTHFPAELVTWPLPHVRLEGHLSADGMLCVGDEVPQGRLFVSLHSSELKRASHLMPLKTKGNLHLNLEGSTLQVTSNLQASKNQFAEVTGTLPVLVNTFPFAVRLDKENLAAGRLLMDGKIEEILDFFDIGTHAARGLLSAQLFLSGSLRDPRVTGEMEMQGGAYENYSTGTRLRHATGKVMANGETLKMEAFHANDRSEGEVNAQGSLDLNPTRRFPFSLSTTLNNMRAIDIDAVKSNFSGDFAIKGDQNGAIALGNSTISWAEIQIPDRLPLEVPELDYAFINQPPDLETDRIAPIDIYPLNLDLKLTAPGHLHVRGRGLSSEWQGDARLTGKNTDLITEGTFHLVKGEYQFAGKLFTLNEGSLHFSEKYKDGPQLSISGSLALPDVTVLVHYRGPLYSPDLTFESVPYMPTSSILSRILFNKDISEISPFQALHLAQVVVSMSGGAGPDVLDTLRKNLGVDRLTITTTEEETGEGFALQIGKYLIEGVMVTLTQSATSSTVMVEAELKKGFFFQAESQDQEEGKFTLRWSYQY